MAKRVPTKKGKKVKGKKQVARKARKTDKELLMLIAAAENLNDVLETDIDTSLDKKSLKRAIAKACKEFEEEEFSELSLDDTTWVVLNSLGIYALYEEDEDIDEEEEEDFEFEDEEEDELEESEEDEDSDELDFDEDEEESEEDEEDFEFEDEDEDEDDELELEDDEVESEEDFEFEDEEDEEEDELDFDEEEEDSDELEDFGEEDEDEEDSEEDDELEDFGEDEEDIDEEEDEEDFEFEDEDEEDEDEEPSLMDELNACSSIDDLKKFIKANKLKVKKPSSMRFLSIKKVVKEAIENQQGGEPMAQKKTSSKKAPAKKKATKKAPAKKAPAKKAPAKKKAVAKKTTKKAPANKKAVAKKATKKVPAKKASTKSGKLSRYGHAVGTQAALMDELVWKGCTLEQAIKEVGKWQKKNKGKVTAEQNRRAAFYTHMKKLKEAGLTIAKTKTGKFKGKSARI